MRLPLDCWLVSYPAWLYKAGVSSGSLFLLSIFDQFAEHDIGRELAGMSKRLDAQPELLDGVAQDLGLGARTGRLGMTAESVLRCGVLKQYRQLSYEELSFHVLDSVSFQAFARLPDGRAPSRATL